MSANVHTGTQFDRTGDVLIGGAEMLHLTTPEGESGQTDWSIQRDVTAYTSVLTRAQPTYFIIGNQTDSTYTGDFYGTLSLTFYARGRRSSRGRCAGPGDRPQRRRQPRTADAQRRSSGRVLGDDPAQHHLAHRRGVRVGARRRGGGLVERAVRLRVGRDPVPGGGHQRRRPARGDGTGLPDHLHRWVRPGLLAADPVTAGLQHAAVHLRPVSMDRAAGRRCAARHQHRDRRAGRL